MTNMMDTAVLMGWIHVNQGFDKDKVEAFGKSVLDTSEFRFLLCIGTQFPRDEELNKSSLEYKYLRSNGINFL